MTFAKISAKMIIVAEGAFAGVAISVVLCRFCIIMSIVGVKL